jgi:hypothetical protein
MGDIKTLNVAEWKQKFNLTAFCETGTLYGDAVEFALQVGFVEIHSIEIMPNLWRKAAERFENNDNVTIHLGHSAAILEDLVKRLSRNTLFWLDAHFPGADSHERAYDAESNKAFRTPLELEVAHISKRQGYKDVIVCDDLWLYEDGPFEWGSFDEHNRKCGRTITRAQLGVGSAEPIVNAFKDTHDVLRLYHHQGYLIFTPKLVGQTKFVVHID